MKTYTQLFFYLLLFTTLSHAQPGIRYLYLETPVYDYVDYQINAGKSVPRFVLRQPYELGRDVSFDEQQAEENYFDRYWQRFYRPDAVNLHLTLGDQVAYDKKFENRYQAEGGIHYTSKNITLANRTSIQQDYKYDAYFAGDLSESDHWLYGRVNEAYAIINFQDFDFFIGRVKRNWGPLGQKSLILSDNPYSYDHLLLNYTRNNFKISLIYAHLENIDGYNYLLPDSLIKNNRKYLVGHRLDIRFSDSFQMAVTEMATYGGPVRDFDFSFLNPMTFYYGLQRNDKKQMNGFWALDVFYKPTPRMTLYSQFLIDDIVVNNDPGVNDRAQYPDRFGVMVSLRSADVLEGLNTEITYNRLWNRTYQSKYTWENYHYRGLGLGYPCASCEELKIQLGYWGFFPLFIQSETIIGRYGDVSFTELFPMVKEDFPIEPVEHNAISTLSLTWFLNPSVTFFASAKYQQRIDHYSNRFGEKSHFIASFGFNWIIGKAVSCQQSAVGYQQ